MLSTVEDVLEIQGMTIRIILVIRSSQNNTQIVYIKVAGFMRPSSLLHQISGIKPYFQAGGVV